MRPGTHLVRRSEQTECARKRFAGKLLGTKPASGSRAEYARDGSPGSNWEGPIDLHVTPPNRFVSRVCQATSIRAGGRWKVLNQSWIVYENQQTFALGARTRLPRLRRPMLLNWALLTRAGMAGPSRDERPLPHRQFLVGRRYPRPHAQPHADRCRVRRQSAQGGHPRALREVPPSGDQPGRKVLERNGQGAVGRRRIGSSNPL